MTMATSIVEYTVKPENVDVLVRRVREQLLPVARQTQGYRGCMLLDRGEGKRLAVLLYDSEADVRAAQQVLMPVGSEHTSALMAGPLTGSVATVLLGDGAFRGPTAS